MATSPEEAYEKAHVTDGWGFKAPVADNKKYYNPPVDNTDDSDPMDDDYEMSECEICHEPLPDYEFVNGLCPYCYEKEMNGELDDDDNVSTGSGYINQNQGGGYWVTNEVYEHQHGHPYGPQPGSPEGTGISTPTQVGPIHSDAVYHYPDTANNDNKQSIVDEVKNRTMIELHVFNKYSDKYWDDNVKYYLSMLDIDEFCYYGNDSCFDGFVMKSSLDEKNSNLYDNDAKKWKMPAPSDVKNIYSTWNEDYRYDDIYIELNNNEFIELYDTGGGIQGGSFYPIFTREGMIREIQAERVERTIFEDDLEEVITVDNLKLYSPDTIKYKNIMSLFTNPKSYSKLNYYGSNSSFEYLADGTVNKHNPLTTKNELSFPKQENIKHIYEYMSEDEDLGMYIAELDDKTYITATNNIYSYSNDQRVFEKFADRIGLMRQIFNINNMAAGKN